MMKNIEIRPFSESYKEAHKAFAAKFWKKKRRLDSKYIEWKFRIGESFNPSFLIAIDTNNNEVVGQFGIIPCTVKVGGEVFSAQWACDLMVNPDYRGMGVAQKLYSEAHKYAEITLGSNPSPKASNSMRRMGYKGVVGPFKYFFPRSLLEVISFKGIRWSWTKYVPNPFRLLNKIYPTDFKRIEIDRYARFKQIQLSNLEAAHVAFDASFVHWRFNSFLTYYPGISTFANGKGSFFSGFYTNKTFYITDFDVKRKSEFFKVLSYIMQEYKDFKLIRFFNNDDTLTNKFLFMGCLKFRTRTDIIYYSENKDIFIEDFYYSYQDSDENL